MIVFQRTYVSLQESWPIDLAMHTENRSHFRDAMLTNTNLSKAHPSHESRLATRSLSYPSHHRIDPMRWAINPHVLTDPLVCICWRCGGTSYCGLQHPVSARLHDIGTS